MPTINQIPTTQTPTDNQIPTGIDESRFGPTPGWQQMRNPRQTLGKIIRHFKAKAAKEIHDAGFEEFRWQPRFHDRIIRGEEELERIRAYIRNNPRNWEADDENPKKGNHNNLETPPPGLEPPQKKNRILKGAG